MLNRIIAPLILKARLSTISLRSPNAVFGKGVKIDKDTQINIRKNSLIVGDNVYLRSNSHNYHAGMPFPTTILIDKDGAQCIIGDNCRINGVYIHAQRKVMIGRNSVIAAGVNIVDSNGHIVKSYDRTKGRDKPEDIVIGENVWIGLNSIILKGTKIGDNSIVAAGSVVKGSFPKNVIIQGNPAKIISTLEY